MAAKKRQQAKEPLIVQPQFRRGDIVELASGSFKMMVLADEFAVCGGGFMVDVIYANKDGLKRDFLPTAVLRNTTSPEIPF